MVELVNWVGQACGRHFWMTKVKILPNVGMDCAELRPKSKIGPCQTEPNISLA